MRDLRKELTHNGRCKNRRPLLVAVRAGNFGNGNQIRQILQNDFLYDQQLVDGRRVNCYGYNSMYATLSSGREVVSQITEPEKFQTRTHRTPDGTTLTIMQKDNEAYLYVYLPESFFEMHMQSDSALSDADVDAVADNLNYGNIGK